MNPRHVLPGLLAALVFGAGPLRAETPQPAVTLAAADFGAVPDDGKDDTEAFAQALAAAKEKGAAGDVVLHVAPGRYDFFPAQASRRACFVSNATDAADPVRTIALDLRDIPNLTLDGPGAEFVMHGKMTLLVAENCRRLALRGMSFDFARPPVSEITVTQVDAQGWTGRVHPDSRYAIEQGKLVWVGEDWRMGPGIIQLCDPPAGTLRRVGYEESPFPPECTVAEESPGVLKVTTAKPIHGQAGDVYQFRDGTRDQVGMWFNHCAGVTLSDVNIYAMAGFGVIAQFTEDVDFERVRVAPREGGGRTCASSADVFHFAMCRGAIVLRDCVMDGAQDDAVNVHGVVLKVVRKLADDRVAVQFGHPQTHGFQAFWPGDEVQFVAQTTLQPIAGAKVAAVAMEADGTQAVTLDGPVPGSVVPDQAVLENLTWTPSVTITGCRVARIPTRGFLLTTPQPVVVENNFFFRTGMPALLIAADAANWFESGAIHDALIEGNVFFECAEPVIDVSPSTTAYGGPVHRNLRIVGNTFVLDRVAASLHSAAGIAVADNTFITREQTPPQAKDFVPKDGPSEVRLSGNRVKKATPELVREALDAGAALAPAGH